MEDNLSEAKQGEECQRLVSNWKTDVWQTKELRCTKLLSLIDTSSHLKKKNTKHNEKPKQ